MSPARRQALVSIILPILLSAVVSVIATFAQSTTDKNDRLIKVETQQVNDGESIKRIEKKLDTVITILMQQQ